MKYSIEQIKKIADELPKNTNFLYVGDITFDHNSVGEILKQLIENNENLEYCYNKCQKTHVDYIPELEKQISDLKRNEEIFCKTITELIEISRKFKEMLKVFIGDL